MVDANNVYSTLMRDWLDSVTDAIFILEDVEQAYQERAEGGYNTELDKLYKEDYARLKNALVGLEKIKEHLSHEGIS